MNARTELNLVVRMRNEAAEILRKHGEETSRVGAAYRLVNRQIEVFRESLQQTAKGMITLTGAVRAARADVAGNPALMARLAGDPAQGSETGRDVAPERIVHRITQHEPVLVRSHRALDQVDEVGRDEGRSIGGPGGPGAAADGWEGTGPRGHRGARAFGGQEFHFGLRQGRALAAVLDIPDLAAVNELKAAVDATLRNQVLLMRSLPAASLWQESRGLGPAIGHSSQMPIEPGMLEALMGKRAPTAELMPAYPTREAFSRSMFDASSVVTTIAAGRRELIAEISAWLSSLSREVTRATMQIKERPEIEDGRRSEERLLERLTLGLKHLVTTGWRFEESAPDRGVWSPERGVPAAESVFGRRASAVMVPEWIGSTSDGGAIGTHLRDVAADWQAYGSGIAKALGATDQVLAGILTQTRDWRSAMHSLINSVVADFARMAIRQNVTGPLADAMFGGGRSTGDGGLLGRAFGWITSLFAGGGVMTSHGPVPLRTYASGGIATRPQLALFGEGSTPEAYVPVPNGRIPVTLRGSSPGVGSIATNIVINMTGGSGGAAGTVAGPDPAEQARNIGALVSAAFNRNLAEQMRPGGLLNPAGTLGTGLAT